MSLFIIILAPSCIKLGFQGFFLYFFQENLPESPQIAIPNNTLDFESHTLIEITVRIG